MTKKYKIFLMVLIVVLLAILVSSCAEEKTYKIFVGKYKPNISGSSKSSLSSEVSKYNFKTYYAKEIISYTDKSVRFIDKQDNEIFINGDRIKVEQVK